jgi:PIN domain nuclease of toxin-antitoxin system
VTFLLDTHILLWWLSDDSRLVEKARELIREPTHLIFVSAASLWELSIKKALGKLAAPDNLESSILAAKFQPLPITFRHALLAGSLPRHHEDPFDRMLIAQAQSEGLTLLTHDVSLRPYGRWITII